MSTLGKILTVLVVVVSIAVAVLVSREFALSENWRNLYEKEATQFQKALGQRDSAIQQHDLLRSQTDAKALLDQQKIETLNKEVAARNDRITVLQQKEASQEQRLQTLTTELGGLNDSFAALMKERDGWRQERDDARKDADTLRTMYTELEGKQTVLLGQFADAKETLRQADEQIKTSQGQVAYLVQETGAKLPPEAAPLPPTNRIEGIVTAVDAAAGVAQISLGSDDGVVKGMKLYVYDKAQGKYLATLTVDKVSHDSAAGQLSIIRGTVGKDSHVTNRFVE